MLLEYLCFLKCMYIARTLNHLLLKKKEKAVSPHAGPFLDSIQHFKQLPLWMVNRAACNKETRSSKLTQR